MNLTNNNEIDISSFLNLVSPEALTGCWLWIGSIDDHNYGFARGPLVKHFFNKKRVYAHRLSAAIYGIDLSKRLIRHLCHNPMCVNPMHLAPGNDSDNALDKIKANRHPKGEDILQSKLTEQQVLEIRSKHIPYKYTISKLAKEYSVSSYTILNVITRKSWKHI